jgi:holo-[acyl-carrier protein] synthase
MPLDLPPPAAPLVGLDLVEVSRFARALARHGEGLRRRVFTEAEWAYAATRGADRPAVLAVRFAAKEAVLKALGTGWGRGVGWRDVEVVGGGRSAPRLRLAGRAAELAEARGLEAEVSLSHAGDVAGAVAYLRPRP